MVITATNVTCFHHRGSKGIPRVIFIVFRFARILIVCSISPHINTNGAPSLLTCHKSHSSQAKIPITQSEFSYCNRGTNRLCRQYPYIGGCFSFGRISFLKVMLRFPESGIDKNHLEQQNPAIGPKWPEHVYRRGKRKILSLRST